MEEHDAPGSRLNESLGDASMISGRKKKKKKKKKKKLNPGDASVFVDEEHEEGLAGVPQLAAIQEQA
jgi:hypothetical protein